MKNSLKDKLDKINHLIEHNHYRITIIIIKKFSILYYRNNKINKEKDR